MPTLLNIVNGASRTDLEGLDGVDQFNAIKDGIEHSNRLVSLSYLFLSYLSRVQGKDHSSVSIYRMNIKLHDWSKFTHS